METNPNITRLLEMLENPEIYTEQEILDIINSDEETREAYRQMVAAKQGYRRKQTAHDVDADAAWQRFEQERLQADSEESATSIALPHPSAHHSQLKKIAASSPSGALKSDLSKCKSCQFHTLPMSKNSAPPRLPNRRVRYSRLPTSFRSPFCMT